MLRRNEPVITARTWTRAFFLESRDLSYHYHYANCVDRKKGKGEAGNVVTIVIELLKIIFLYIWASRLS